MPGIVAAVDGFHIAIHGPPILDELYPGNLYINRKGYHSLNVLVAGSADLKIVFADAKYPGSVHDSAVWQTSSLKIHIQNVYTNSNSKFWLLGDSGYPIEPWLLTPLPQCPENSKESRYNAAHKGARNVIERLFGVLKSRFRCLLRHRTLHYKPDVAGNIFYAVSILHNICIENNVQLDDEINEDDDNIDGMLLI